MAGTVNLDTPEQVDSRRAIFARWLWPSRCLVCSAAGERRRDLCAACAAGLPWLAVACRHCALPLAETTGPTHPAICGACLRGAPPVLTEAHAACFYRAPLDRLLPRFKFHRDLAAGRLLAQLMAARLGPLAVQWSAPATLVPVPLHWRRLRQRGYDQALELARPLAAMLGLPLATDALERARHTDPQSTLAADRRRANLRDAFRVGARTALPAHVVLVDDVMTTGATLQAAAVALRAAGVARVDAWVCARVP